MRDTQGQKIPSIPATHHTTFCTDILKQLYQMVEHKNCNSLQDFLLPNYDNDRNQVDGVNDLFENQRDSVDGMRIRKDFQKLEPSLVPLPLIRNIRDNNISRFVDLQRFPETARVAIALSEERIMIMENSFSRARVDWTPQMEIFEKDEAEWAKWRTAPVACGTINNASNHHCPQSFHNLNKVHTHSQRYHLLPSSRSLWLFI